MSSPALEDLLHIMAGLIPQSFIDDLLARTDLVELIGARLSLKKTGKNYSARCPFHDEKSPSFTVSPDKQFYYCFGCGAKGNALGFLMEHDHLDFPSAVEELARRAGLEVPRETRSDAPSGPPVSLTTPLYNLLEQACTFYREALKSHPTRSLAVNYLKARGLTGTIARDFGLGFAPAGWDHLLRQWGDSPERQRLLLEAGLLVENADTGKRYDRFRDRIMFPIRDTKGRVMGFGGRVLGDEKPKYLNSPESPVFHKGREVYGLYEVQKFNRHLSELLIVEGYMDVIALAQQGIRNAVAVLGTATTEDHIRRLFRLTSNLVFCFDGDPAGRKAAWRALESCLPQLEDGRLVRFLFLPEGEDPDSLVRKEGPIAFQHRLRQQAQTLTDYCFQHCAEGLNLGSLEGKAQLSAQLSPLIERIPGQHLQALMRQHLSQQTGLEMPSTGAEPPKAAPFSVQNRSTPARVFRPSGVHTRPEYPATNPSSRVETPMLIALRTLLHHPELACKVEDARHLAATDSHSQLMIDLLCLLQKQPELGPLQLMARWHGTEQGQLLRALMEKEWLICPDNLEQQFFDTITRLMARQREQDLEVLQEKIRNGTLNAEEKNRLRQLLQRSAVVGAVQPSGKKDHF